MEKGQKVKVKVLSFTGQKTSLSMKVTGKFLILLSGEKCSVLLSGFLGALESKQIPKIRDNFGSGWVGPGLPGKKILAGVTDACPLPGNHRYVDRRKCENSSL